MKRILSYLFFGIGIVIVIAIASFFFKCSENFYYIMSPLSTLFVAIIGYFFTVTYQSKVKQVEIINRILNDRRSLFDKVSYCINSRLFDYSRVLWAIENIDENQYTFEECLSILNRDWMAYRETVRKYNFEVRTLSKQILYIFGEDINNLFYTDEEFECENPVDNAKSIAGKFTHIHAKTLEMKKQICSNGYGDDDKVAYKKLKSEHGELTSSINEFLAKLSEMIFSQEKIEDSVNKMEQIELIFPGNINNKTKVLCSCPSFCRYKRKELFNGAIH